MTELRQLVHAEWIKLRSLRSSKWTIAVLVLTTIGLGALISYEAASSFHTFSAHDKRTWDPTNNSLAGAAFGQLAVAVFGVLAITAEYASGTIRSSVAAAPRRTPLLAAKALVYGGVALVVGEVISFTSYFVGQSLHSGRAPISHIGDPGVFRAVAMTGGYLALVCLMALGVGLALRHTAGAIAAMVAVLLVLPGVFAALPSGAQNAVEKFLPEQIAASSTGAVLAEPHYFGPWTGMSLLVLYAAVAMGVGTWSFVRRDV
ncbi:MAG TPA: ABC transporter permease subunit [Mycobacteriales bacterium]|nr:ABC transporter permease subunit [Mycobacteriales bacterium]